MAYLSWLTPQARWWSQGADRVSPTVPVAVNELLDGCLVRSVVTRRPERMSLIERTVVKNSLMHGTSGYEDEATNACSSCRLDQLQRADHVLLDELDRVTLGPAESHTWSVQRRVDNCVAAVDQPVAAIRVAQVALDPFEITDVVESLEFAGGPMPTTKLVPLVGEVCGDVVTNESGGAR